jgi:hypothetical protein
MHVVTFPSADRHAASDCSIGTASVARTKLPGIAVSEGRADGAPRESLRRSGEMACVRREPSRFCTHQLKTCRDVSFRSTRRATASCGQSSSMSSRPRSHMRGRTGPTSTPHPSGAERSAASATRISAGRCAEGTSQPPAAEDHLADAASSARSVRAHGTVVKRHRCACFTCTTRPSGSTRCVTTSDVDGSVLYKRRIPQPRPARAARVRRGRVLPTLPGT